MRRIPYVSGSFFLVFQPIGAAAVELLVRACVMCLCIMHCVCVSIGVCVFVCVTVSVSYTIFQLTSPRKLSVSVINYIFNYRIANK